MNKIEFLIANRESPCKYLAAGLYEYYWTPNPDADHNTVRVPIFEEASKYCVNRPDRRLVKATVSYEDV